MARQQLHPPLAAAHGSPENSFEDRSVKILALETTEKTGSLAALDGARVLYQMTLAPQKRTTQSLAPGISRLLRAVGWSPCQVELVAVAIGPGSFTGLRVGLTAAKTFAYATGATLLGVDTLEAVAARAPQPVESLWVSVDAQRNQVVAGQFRRDQAGWMRPTGPARLVDADQWVRELPPKTVLSGPAMRLLRKGLPPHLRPLEPGLWAPTAASVGQLAARDYGEGRRDDLWSLVPVYSRPSAAEEKWRARHRSANR
ncbi:MAG TPA: tRNA (adenosine(37)-N6)-threonylcarbamoyltransferase complex dimerization subunit type 1 TsaB [Planctomycetes bacterium]|nr:tRNA (adenosine(37)-N6)-threonylcarbamoyltransferase complex dimerization subunit type 1 TsaB [Planctomycetota bacterium]